MKCFEELKARGYVYQATDDAVEGLLNDGRAVFYAGFDPTADSLHAGHLQLVMKIRRLQAAGHVPVILVGGATALVGDPSGKTEARPIQARELVAENAEKIKRQLSRFIDVSEGKAHFVNNLDWFKDLQLIDFLRDIGSRFSVNKMIAAESVKQRLETGISYLEFSYMLLQAYDFLVLNRDLNCNLQIGGQDQWGNIVAGIELVRRMEGKEVFGLTMPLLLNSQGEKFGKSAGNAVWLDEARTSVFDYYQFWRNTPDSEVGILLLRFTSLPVDEVKELGKLESPLINRAKEILAFEATALAHGVDAAKKVYSSACAKFGYADPEGKVRTSSAITGVAYGRGDDDLPSHTLNPSDLEGEGVWIVKLFTDSGLCSSSGEARRLIKGGGAYLNDDKISDQNLHLVRKDFEKGEVVLKAGRKNLRKIKV